MGDQTVSITCPQQIDLDTLQSRIKEVTEDIHRSSHDVPQLLKDSYLEVQTGLNRIVSDFSSLPVEDLDAFLSHLKGELSSAQAQKAKISMEIEQLTRTYVEDSNRLECDLEALNCSLDFIASQGLERAKADARLDCSVQEENQMDLFSAREECKFKILELSHQVEKNEETLKSLLDLECIFKRFEAMEKIEDALTGLKVIEFEGNRIRLSLRTYIPNLESILSQQKVEDIIDSLELSHELVVEVVDGAMQPKNVEIFPNDVYLGEIVEAAKSFRQLSSPLPLLETRSPLEWFVRRVQDRIVLCTLRQFIVKSANQSRHSFEYLDRDEIIVAHTVGGVDAFIKVPQGWPISSSALTLVSLKSTNQYSKEISLSFLCKVEELANSLDAHIRQNIPNFVDAIEEILVQRMRAELQADENSDK